MSERATKMEAAISELVAAFPAALTLDPMLVRPVKLGIRNDLYGQSSISRRRITAALRTYCNSVPYLKASVEGAVRVDLAGEPAGAVTATEALHARKALAAITKATAKVTGKIDSQSASRPPEGVRIGHPSGVQAAQKKGSETSKRPQTAEAATPDQKRSSLSDLKLAAAARKAKR
jgi:ProP effector